MQEFILRNHSVKHWRHSDWGTSEIRVSKTHTVDWSFVSGLYWYCQVSSSMTMSDTLFDFPPLNRSIMWWHQVTPLLFGLGELMRYPPAANLPDTQVIFLNVSHCCRSNPDVRLYVLVGHRRHSAPHQQF